MNTVERKQVTIRATSLGALKYLVNQTPLDLDCGGPRRHFDGAVTIRAYVTLQDIVDIREALGVEIIDIREVDTGRPRRPARDGHSQGSRFFPRNFGRKGIE
jgi:hypothetical protein